MRRDEQTMQREESRGSACLLEQGENADVLGLLSRLNGCAPHRVLAGRVGLAGQQRLDDLHLSPPSGDAKWRVALEVFGVDIRP